MVCLALLVSVGCSRTPRAAAPAPTGQPTQSRGPARTEQAPSASIRTPPPPARTPAATAPSAPPPATPATSSEFLQTDRGQAVPARDFMIGKLQVPGVGGGAVQDASAVLSGFLDALAKGAIDSDLLDPLSSSRITRSISYYSAKGMVPTRYRVGLLKEAADGSIVANVRLYGAKGVTQGEVYLVKGETGWRIADIQAGFAELLEPYTPPTEPFVPSSYEYGTASSGASGE